MTEVQRLKNRIAYLESLLKNHHHVTTQMSETDRIELAIVMCCAINSVDRNLMTSKSRKREAVFARFQLCALLRKYTSLSLNKIGGHLNNRDHSTILHSLAQHEDLLSQNFQNYGKTFMSLEKCYIEELEKGQTLVVEFEPIINAS